MNLPEWLTRRAGGLKQASDRQSWFVMLNGEPVYTIVPRPVGDKFGCFIKQTNSGRPIDSPSTVASEEDALAAGLEDLRKALGW